VRRRDALASVVLLSLGFLSTVYTVVSALELDRALRQLYAMYGGDGDYEPAGDIPLAQAVLISSHVILFTVAVLGTMALVRARRVSFWVPLVAGAIAAVVFFATVAALVLGDAALLEAGMRFSSP